MTKTEIRKQMKGLNTALSSEQREELSARIFNEAERLPAFARAKVVALFASLKDEPLTAPALERWSRSKRIVLPRVEGDIMRFYDYDPASMNDSGSFGISEPEATALCRPEEIDFIIVPGVAFTAAGMRLGRGQGILRQIPVAAGFPGFQGRRVLSASSRGGAARRSVRRSGRSPLLRTVKRVPTLVPQSNPTVPTCSPNRRRTPSGFRHRKPANTGYGKES